MALPSFTQLRYLVALYEHRHFGRAAESCNVSQPTLSVGLKELEATLGLQLVERDRRAIAFTPTGVNVVHRAEDLLARARALSRLGAPSPSGALRLSIIPTIAPFLLPRIFPGVRHAHPALAFEIHEEMSREGCAALSTGARDCMILALPWDCSEFDHATLFEDPIMVVARPDDPLAQQSSVDPRDLMEKPILLLHEGHCLREHALRACGRHAHEPAPPAGASIQTLIHLVNADLGVALVPELAIDAGVTAGLDVVTRPLTGRKARRTVCVAWRRDSPRADDMAALTSTLRRFCASKPLNAPETAIAI
jgi:LysR family hydrogen peroxide-inducible transcriptional activator